jgi:hypothetical protein
MKALPVIIFSGHLLFLLNKILYNLTPNNIFYNYKEF